MDCEFRHDKQPQDFRINHDSLYSVDYQDTRDTKELAVWGASRLPGTIEKMSHRETAKPNRAVLVVKTKAFDQSRRGGLMEKFKMLVVDDETDFLETIVKRLKARNIEVAGVESGSQALEALDRQDFDVVILDVKMPGMDGIETLREIKKKKPFTEVIMLTGHASVESGIQGMQLGAFDYVMKPVALDELLEKVRQAYERKLIQENKA